MICKKTEDEPAYCPDRNDLLQIIKTMQKFSLLLKYGAIVYSYANHVARIIDQHFADKIRLEIRICEKVLLKDEILPHYQNSRFFRTYTSYNKMSGPLHVWINGCLLY